MEEQKFWSWFVENSAVIQDFINKPRTDYKIYNELSARLKEYNEYIIPEITGGKHGNYILILSADGLSEGIGPVERLYDAAPVINGWTIKKFRQPGLVNELNYNGLYVKEKDIRVRYTPNDDLFDIEVLIKGFKEHKLNYQALGLLYLDHFIGEYDVMNKIGVIKFSRLGWFTAKEGLLTLSQFLSVVNATKEGN